MTVLAEPATTGWSSTREHPLAGLHGPRPIARFIDTVAPAEVRTALRDCLPAEAGDPELHLVRAKLKPGRTLTAEYHVVLPEVGVARRICATWIAHGASPPGAAADVEAEARRRGVLAPFHRSWVGSPDGRMSLRVAPVDGAFPQLVRLHDPAHLVDVLGATAPGEALEARGSDAVTVETVRYRPGQRHVLRVGAGPGRRASFVKVYRDETGRRAVDAAGRAATAFAAAGDGAPGVSAGGGVYVAADRATVWPQVTGTSLADGIVRSGATAADVVRTAGYALRLVHDAPTDAALPVAPDAAAQARETLRTAHLLDVLLPAVGRQLRRGVHGVMDVLDRLPVEAPRLTHGDFKCDNLMDTGSRVHVLDFDRSARGDPAADVGKFLADLRWWADQGGQEVAPLHEAFLHGYGSIGPARLARAHAYATLLHLRMAARRVPIQDADWADRVSRAVGIALDSSAGGARP